MIKEMILENEKNKVIKLLEENDLRYEEVTETIFIEENNEIVGTLSMFNNIFKCLAVKKTYQSNNYAHELINYFLSKKRDEGIYHFMVYTKLQYEVVFESFGFKKIINTDKVVVLEQGYPNIYDVLDTMKRKVESRFSIKVRNENIASIVMNANPITEGHLYLIEKASSNHDYVIVFLLEEDRSFFSFKERLSLAYLSTIFLQNVIIIPSSEYIISNLTFPGYFLKKQSEQIKEWAKVDANIFKEYFMKELNICYRYIGEEYADYMKEYNTTLHKVLEKNIIEIPRYNSISASTVRTYIKQNKIEEAIALIPRGAQSLFREILKSKNE